MAPAGLWMGVVLVFSLTCSALTQEITYNIPEEEERGYRIGNLITDLNLETNSETRFQLLTTTAENETYFDLNSITGELTTSQSIDREIVCPTNTDSLCQYELEVLALPRTFIVIRVIIEDINDHTPSFSKGLLFIDFPETVAIGTRIPLESAKDPDIGDNAIQGYELINNFGKFALVVQRYVDNTVSLQLEVTGELDRESRSLYLLVLLVHDGGDPRRTGSATLNVTVLDSNDNAPQFRQAVYIVNVEENTDVGEQILQVEAVDPDTGTNGQIEYTFSSSVPQATHDVVEIDKDTGIIRVKGVLDREQQSIYQLIVKAVNRVTNPIPDFTTVTIHVIDLNDNAPSLTVNALKGNVGREVHLTETIPQGTLIAFIKASDPDSGRSGMVRISLANTHSDFGLQEVSQGQYFLATLRLLDREAVAVYNISIIAEDMGTPTKTSTEYFTIVMEDVNDNAPYFASPIYYTGIQENNAVSSPFFTLTAVDSDEGINKDITYYLYSGRDKFAVGVSSGVITAEVQLNREEMSSIVLLASACDNGVPILCSNVSVVVEVEDQNDNPPVFQQSSYEFDIEESAAVRSIVGYTRATDADSGPNSQISYTMRKADANGADDYFRIVAQTGKIVNTRLLDYEERESFQFTVIASDHGVNQQLASVLVTVIIQDANDNAPQLIFPNVSNDTFFIPQSADPGFLVLSVNASDRDKGINSVLSYSIHQDHDIFSISPSGRLLTAQSLQSSWEGVHILTVLIQDGGSPVQETKLPVTIVITDLDFNTSLPADVFFDRFNLTAADFGLIAEDKGDTETSNSPELPWTVILAIVLGSLALFLILVFVLILFKCRPKTLVKSTYVIPPEEVKSTAIDNVDYIPETQQEREPSVDSSLCSMPTSHGSIPSRNINKWRAQAGAARATDSRLDNQQMTTFGSNSDIVSETSTRRTPDADAEVQRLLHNRQRHEFDALSDNSNRSSYDSGQGSHDDQEATHDTYPSRNQPARSPNGQQRSASCPKLSTASGVPLTREHYMASPQCTPECATLGHSDDCWNVPPRPRSASAGLYSRQPVHKAASKPEPYGNEPSRYPVATSLTLNGRGRKPVQSSSNHSNGNRSNNNHSNGNSSNNNHSNGYPRDWAAAKHTSESNTAPSTKHNLNGNNSHGGVNASTTPESKRYCDGTPLVLTPITEDPMEITDGRNAQATRPRNDSVYTGYDTCGAYYPASPYETDIDSGITRDTTIQPNSYYSVDVYS